VFQGGRCPLDFCQIGTRATNKKGYFNYKHKWNVFVPNVTIALRIYTDCDAGKTVNIESPSL
jgi:hypothetical protein